MVVHNRTFCYQRHKFYWGFLLFWL